jgi:hypothetical protein
MYSAAEFNEWNPVGTAVTLTDSFGDEHFVNTRSPAFCDTEGTPVVRVTGRGGEYKLSRIVVLESHK